MSLKLLILATLALFCRCNCPNEPNCQQCSVSVHNRCLLCYRGYVSPIGRCITTIEDKIDKCAYYEALQVKNNLKIQCRTCEAEYYLHAKLKTCFKCELDHCYLCTAANNCLACKAGYLLDHLTGKCVLNNKSFSNSECEIYLSTNAPENNEAYCLVCKYTGALLSFHSGFCVRSEIENCLVLAHKSKTKCQICKQGFYIGYDGQCIGNQDFEQIDALRSKNLCLNVNRPKW